MPAFHHAGTLLAYSEAIGDRPLTRTLISLTALAALAAPLPALACAGFYHDPDEYAESAYQEAIFRMSGDQIQVDYKVNLDVSTPSFGWVIPVPGEVSGVTDGDANEFEELYTVTEPEFDLEEPRDGIGCGVALKSDSVAGGFSTSNGVTVVYSGATPTYSYDVVQATSSDALLGWLDDNGWDVGTTSSTIEDYVVEGGYQFVALKLAMEVSPGEGVQATLPPLRLTYAGDRMAFPSRMAENGVVEQIKTIVYVIGDGRAHVSGWTETEVPLVWDDGESPEYMRYTAWPEEVQTIGSNGGYAVTYSGPYQDQWVTRFQTDAPRIVHAVDAEFTLSSDRTELRTLVSNQGGCNTPPGASLLLVPLLGLLRRRRA